MPKRILGLPSLGATFPWPLHQHSQCSKIALGLPDSTYDITVTDLLLKFFLVSLISWGASSAHDHELTVFYLH